MDIFFKIPTFAPRMSGLAGAGGSISAGCQSETGAAPAPRPAPLHREEYSYLAVAAETWIPHTK